MGDLVCAANWHIQRLVVYPWTVSKRAILALLMHIIMGWREIMMKLSVGLIVT